MCIPDEMSGKAGWVLLCPTTQQVLFLMKGDSRYLQSIKMNVAYKVWLDILDKITCEDFVAHSLYNDVLQQCGFALWYFFVALFCELVELDQY